METNTVVQWMHRNSLIFFLRELHILCLPSNYSDLETKLHVAHVLLITCSPFIV